MKLLIVSVTTTKAPVSERNVTIKGNDTIVNTFVLREVLLKR